MDCVTDIAVWNYSIAVRNERKINCKWQRFKVVFARFFFSFSVFRTLVCYERPNMRFNATKRCHTLVVIKTFSNITNYRNLNTEFEPRLASVTNIRHDRALIRFSYINLFSICKSPTYIIFLTNFSEKVAIFNVFTFWADFFLV